MVRIGILLLAEERRRPRILPAQRVPVIHVLAEDDQVCPCYRLRAVEIHQQPVGRRTARASLGSEQLNQHRRAGIWRIRRLREKRNQKEQKREQSSPFRHRRTYIPWISLPF